VEPNLAKWLKKIFDERGKHPMKSTGIVRKVDELGRIVLPIELRRTMGIAERDPLEIYVDGNTIVLRQFQDSCVFCNSSNDVTVFKGKNVCNDCLKELTHNQQ
jgi:transcriptional pleiotropic regulator of transition state genes